MSLFLLCAIASSSAMAQTRQPIACGDYYIVQRGDYLAEIARRTYGPEAGWEDVWAPNRHILRRRDPSAVDIGAILWLPCPETRERKAQDAPSPATTAGAPFAADGVRAAQPAPSSPEVAETETAPAASASPAQIALWTGAPDDPALARLKAGLEAAELGWEVADHGEPGLLAPLERAACDAAACRGAIWSGVLREMAVLSFSADRQARGRLCVSAGVAALAGRRGEAPENCLAAVRAGRAARAELTDVEAESTSIPPGVSEDHDRIRIAPLRAAFPADARAQAKAFDAALRQAEAAP